MALKGSTQEEQIWNFLKAEIGNDYGAAGLIGNLYAESGLNTRNLENLCERRLKEAGKAYCTDEAYTSAVDSGVISREEFLNPLPGKQYGYGLAQWTSTGRKAGLYDLAKSKGVSIGDLETQLEFLCYELENSYKSVLSTLKSATGIKEVSDVVLMKFENPKDKSDSVKNKRSGYCQMFFDKYAKGGKKVSIKVGSARLDENGKLSGGAAGDQTGKEVSTQNYYLHSKGWYLLRPKSVEDANKLASAMQNACDNDNIGYDQNERLDIITQIKKYGSMAKIAVKTEADCGTLVRGCCIEAGFDPGNFTTSGEATALSKTGRFENKVAVTSSTVLYNGDVLVTKTKGHTVIVTEGNPRKNGVTQETKQSFVVGRNYILQNDMYIRDSANGKKKQFTKLTANAKSHGYADQDGNGILKKGTSVTCKEVQEKDGAIWINIPSGWICAVGASGKVYVK